MIEVVAVDDSSGQFLGEMPGGRRGWFPRDYVEILGMPVSVFFDSVLSIFLQKS